MFGYFSFYFFEKSAENLRDKEKYFGKFHGVFSFYFLFYYFTLQFSLIGIFIRFGRLMHFRLCPFFGTVKLFR
jgi:hypothetical protein